MTFINEQRMAAYEKQAVYQDWRRFICGFKPQFFSQALYGFLYQNCGFRKRQDGAAAFWGFYFNGDVQHLRMFMNQFGGNKQSAEYVTDQWTGRPAADLKEAMCQEMARLYEPLMQVLKDLEAKYEELARVWYQFAAADGVRDTDTFPDRYLVGENARHMLAYAASIVRQRATTGPLGLQLQFPPPLLQEVSLLQPAVGGEGLVFLEV